MVARDDGEITFYEELGVAPDAPPEKIREAFRLFVRLLHPDQQTDPQLREMAEAQMRKLNRVYAVLSDPESRRAYDAELDTDFSPPPVILNSFPSPDFRRWVPRMSWVAAIVLSAGLLIWLASDNTPGVQSRASDPNTGRSAMPVSTVAFPGKPVAPEDSEAAEISRLRSDLRAVILERNAAVRELDEARGAQADRSPDNRASQVSPSARSSPPEGTPPNAPLAIAELPAVPKLPALTGASIPRIENPANRRLEGFWFYAIPPEGQTNKNQSLYIPEYIEATITENGGVIQGRYRSRFVIADRAISPDVNFTFTGTANGAQCSGHWTGAGGARGDLTLKLTSENSLRVDWTASELGNQQGLNSGTAVLTRRIE